EVFLRINTSDPPLTSASYNLPANYTDYRYYKSGNELKFDNGVTEESLMQNVTVTAVNFSKSEEALTGYITANYGIGLHSQTMTFYFSCYPRCASFK
ncbi:MAG: hypothetical protein Q8N67_00940, partial [Candidatus Omnitrophota bacterium]|nr:hypothetical protein [Candidatus Omnitrophota bacterium]